jgi:TonB family protein
VPTLRSAGIVPFILLAFCTCVAQQNAPSVPVAAPQITIPSYPDTTGGLEDLMHAVMKASNSGDQPTLSAYGRSLVLSKPDDWFNSVFGPDLGPAYTASSESARVTIVNTVGPMVAGMLKENRKIIEAVRFDDSCNHNATDKEYPVLLKRVRPEPLYDVRFRADSTNAVSIVSFFAYVDGGFRYIGNLRADQPIHVRANPALQSSQPGDNEPLRIRVGGNVAAAQLIHKVTPVYSDEAKRARVEGTVSIHAIISKDGSVRDAQIIQGRCVLAEPALDAVKKWRYKPTLLEGKPVEVDTMIQVMFQLH